MRTIAPKKKRKMSVYNRFVQRFSKTYTGKPENMMKAAARAWKSKTFKFPTTTGSPKKKTRKSSPKTKTRRKTRMAKKKTKKRSGFRLPGGLGPKGILTGVLGLMFVPRILPVQTPGQQMLGTGLALRALSLGGGGALSAAGMILTMAEFLSPRIGGFVGGGASSTSGGYDY